MADNFAGFNTGLDSPFVGGATVTPHDTNDLAIASRALYATGAGDIHVDTVDGSELTWTVAALSYHNIRVTRVYSTGTTATGIIAFY